MRGWDLDESPTVALNGEWKFYPGKLLTHRDTPLAADQARNIQVPGDWSGAQAEDSGSSYGYGTYQLRILIEPPDQPIAFWLQGIQASSSVEINGLAAAQTGEPAAAANEYKPKNISYTASHSVEGATEIELLIRVANFDDPYKGGILSPIRFGSQAAIDYVRWYSIGFQLVSFVILLLHGLYASILCLFNPGERTLLFVVLLTLAVGVSVVAGHDNLLMLWLPINYTWALKIRLLSLLWQTFFILLVFRRFSSAPPKNNLLRIYTVSLIAFSGLLLVAPAPLVNGMFHLGIFTVFYLFPFAWFIYIVGTMIFKKQTDNDSVFLMLSAAGIMCNFLWSLWDSIIREVTAVYYPIDIIAAIVGFSTYWFKKYFRNASENAKLNEQLQKADKLKDQFLANTSHELRTPLHGIMNIAQNVVAKEKEMLNERSLKDMELLITISRRMSHMLGDLLDVARLQEHRIVLQQEPLQIQSTVPGVIGMLKYMMESKPIQLNMDIAESLPPVMADEKRLVQILYNLLHNALKYTEEGTISISAETRNGHAIIHISDTGVGMDDETQERIFLPYEQGSYGISDGRGIGLGLSICKQLIELHGGTLTVRSEPGMGSVFSFELPLAASSSFPLSQPPLQHRQLANGMENEPVGSIFSYAAIGELAAAASLAPPLLNTGKVNILAVDDDPVNLNVLVGILSSGPYTITTAGSAREALDLLGTQSWDLLIADVMMPHMSGYELTHRVRKHYSVSELPVLLLTARSQPADIYAGFLSGANDYVTKPVDAMELQYRIRALTAMKQSMDERLRMEAAYLQAQIHPHFLFNTLNSIMALSDIDTKKMRQLGDAFTSFLRISFHFLNTGELVELSHELELVEAYLYIEKARFEDRLSIVWEVEPDIGLLLPPLSIQPLIENAVKHGLLSRSKGGTVKLRVIRQDGFTLIEVKDDGKGMEQDQVVQLLSATMKGKGGIGLSNTNRRLTQLYGQGLSIRSKPDEGTTVSFVIPDSRAEMQKKPISFV
ncbi:ATP-binding protein [Cohnella faecalis]